MILLWMYAYSFLFLPDVAVDNGEGLARRIPFKRYEGDGAQPPFRAYFDREMIFLRVFDYLSQPDGPLSGFADDCKDIYAPLFDSQAVRRPFSGSELLTYINAKLKAYDWGALNEKNSFDFYIQSLSGFTVEFDGGGEVSAVRCQGQPVTGEDIRELCADNSNIPAPLVLMRGYFQCVKDAGREPFPLSCKSYEQL